MAVNKQTHWKRLAAFEYYWGLGEGRSYQDVALEFGCSKSTVNNWSRADGWKDRLVEREKQIAAKVAQGQVDSVAAAKIKYQGIVRGAVNDFVERFKKKEIEVKSVADLERLIKMDLLLMGSATERIEVVTFAAEVAEQAGSGGFCPWSTYPGKHWIKP
jgi:hypothetical protein